MSTLATKRLSNAAALSDAELLLAIAEGELGPLGILFDRYHEPLRQFLLRAAPNVADVDDLVQETFLTATRAAASFDGRASALPFLMGIATQLLRRRKRTFARLRALYDAFCAAPTASRPSPEERVNQAQEEALLQAAIARLSDERRIVLVMVEYNGMSGPEVAQILGTPVGTVWRRLHEARAELRRTLQRGER
ncbi:RNA polymerase sigma factor [Polyangium mundeleinium]|uniref:RNA polymerase sigma factor n=1 Tax=Polyangium mundeleinium TaxID=2995306 RepID=A0ABT5EIG3_9BACT|nr:RNA polymerase sigma factor [Polyangium mundeleinium]MDC0741600.1 RNA polymerase sigma factor [Polyangium mundeleinium]